MTPLLKPIKYLIEQAQLHPAAALETETHQSYPIPVVVSGALRAMFLYCPSQLDPDEGLYLDAPTYRAALHAVTGKFEDLRATTPVELGLSHSADAVLGKYGLPEGVTPEQFLQLQEKLYEYYDALLPLFAKGSRHATPRLAREFERTFALVTEPPLKAFYRAVGRKFFDWLAEGG